MVARILLATNIAINTRIDEALGKHGAEQQVVEPQARIAPPPVALVVPERVDRFARVSHTDRIDPSLVQQSAERRSAGRLNQGVLCPGFRRVDVHVSRDNVVVAGQDDREAACDQPGCMRDQAIEPGEFIGEFRARLWIPVRQVNAADQGALERQLDVAALLIRQIPWQCAACDDQLGTAPEDSNTIPGPLSLPGGSVACRAQCVRREGILAALQFLQADNIRLRSCQPVEQVRKPSIDVVDIERGNLQSGNSRLGS